MNDHPFDPKRPECSEDSSDAGSAPLDEELAGPSEEQDKDKETIRAELRWGDEGPWHDLG